MGKPSDRGGSRPEAIRGVRIVGRRLQHRAQLDQRRRRDRADERPPAGVALVERWRAYADALGDRLHRDRVETAGLEELSAGSHDLGVGRPRLGRTHAFGRPIRPRWVSWNEPGSFRPYPTARSIPTWAMRIEATSRIAGAASQRPTARPTMPSVQLWKRLYVAVPSLGPTRYPAAERSGSRISGMAKSQFPPVTPKSVRPATKAARPSSLSHTLTAPLVIPATGLGSSWWVGAVKVAAIAVMSLSLLRVVDSYTV